MYKPKIIIVDGRYQIADDDNDDDAEDFGRWCRACDWCHYMNNRHWRSVIENFDYKEWL